METRNTKGNLHSFDDKPAIINENGSKWYKNGEIHRDNDLPACIYGDGSQVWYKNGKRHRENDLPAVSYIDGSQFWFKNGKQHRENNPAVIEPDGTATFYFDNELIDKYNPLIRHFKKVCPEYFI